MILVNFNATFKIKTLEQLIKNVVFLTNRFYIFFTEFIKSTDCEYMDSHNSVMKKLMEINNNLQQIKHDQQQIISLLNSKKESDNIDEKHIKFPIQKLEELNCLEKNCINDSVFCEKLKTHVRNFQPAHNGAMENSSTYGLSKICLDSVLSNFTWHGTENKLAFKKLTLLNEILFQAWKKPNVIVSYADYYQSIKYQLESATARTNSKLKRLIRRNSDEETPEHINTENEYDYSDEY